jgi:hypothetical protein
LAPLVVQMGYSCRRRPTAWPGMRINADKCCCTAVNCSAGRSAGRAAPSASCGWASVISKGLGALEGQTRGRRKEMKVNCCWLQGSIHELLHGEPPPFATPTPLHQTACFTNARFGTAKLFPCSSAAECELPSCELVPPFPAGCAKYPNELPGIGSGAERSARNSQRRSLKAGGVFHMWPKCLWPAVWSLKH